MSSLLEQAIIDANMLREAALKNAEKNVLDKYSDVVKKTMESLLEAEGGDDSMLLDTPEQRTEIAAATASEVPFANVPDTFATKEDETVRIDFSSLNESMELAEMIRLSMLQDQMEEERLIDPEEAAEMEKEEQKIKPEGFDHIDSGTYAHMGMEEELTEETLEEETSLLDELELDEEQLEEVLKVDMSVGNQGHLGYDPVSHREMENMARALVVAEENAEKSKKKADKLEEAYKQNVATLREVQEALELVTESYSTLKQKFKDTVSEKSETETKLTVAEQNVNILRENIESLRISNAKLLYTNKVLGNSSLNERQKQSLVETISKTDTVEKVKAIYETLQSGVQSIPERKVPESLSEAISRNSLPFHTRKSATPANSPMVDRMQILAGIKKTN